MKKRLMILLSGMMLVSLLAFRQQPAAEAAAAPSPSPTPTYEAAVVLDHVGAVTKTFDRGDQVNVESEQRIIPVDQKFDRGHQIEMLVISTFVYG